MVQKKIVVCECGCERCTYNWVSRKKISPIVCPNCKSPYWDKPKLKKGRKNKNA